MKRHFTLVEVLIAMGVCVVGVCSIMALFPVGLANSRDAGTAGLSSNTADQMLHLMKAIIVNESNTEEQAATYFQALTGFAAGHFNTGIAATDAQPKPAVDGEPDSDDDWVKVNGTTPPATLPNSMKETIKALNIMIGKVISNDDLTVSVCTTPGIYKVERGGTMEDMECIVRLWAEPVGVALGSSKGGVAYLPRTARFHAEVSWPVRKSYAKRQKQEYTMDVYCPPRESAPTP